jgi:gliding motility-associated protein GldE
VNPAILFSYFVLFSGKAVPSPDYGLTTGLIINALLLIVSALLSASEIAYFKLKQEDIEKLKSGNSQIASRVLKLIDKPGRLLNTILTANIIVTVAFVLVAAFLRSLFFDFSGNPAAAFAILFVITTFILLIFGEVIPKIIASRNQLKTAMMLSLPMRYIEIIFIPVTSLLTLSSSFVKSRAGHLFSNAGMNDLSGALELNSDKINEDEKILKGILNFGNINVSEIMCPRIDVTSININLGFNKVKSVIIESGFSRIPVFSGSFDSVKGILYAKDVLPHTNSSDNFRWQTLMRPVHFVPETKKINELLKEFQIKKIHMAVVIDEFGGTSGIITLEDILEEIVGEITDESDEDEKMHRKLDDQTYIFEGKILLNDFFKIIEMEDDRFDDVRGESETLAGLILELTGEIPQKGQVVIYHNFKFRIESADKRRIKEIRVELTDRNEQSQQM